MEFKTLGRTGLRVSVIAFGASPLGNEFGNVDPADGERAVSAAIDDGINLFDVSPYYGRTLAEQRLGAALAGKRHKVILATKCGRYDKNCFDFSAKRVTTSIDESLSRLQTDYVDLLTAHDIEFGHRDEIIHETLPAMRELQQMGKVRYVGISGLPLKLLADVAQRGNVDFVLSYCHYNLLARDLDLHLTPVLSASQIGLINASPLHMGILTATGAPAWHPAPELVKQTGAKIVDLCLSRGLSPASIALRFCLDHTYASSTLVGMASLKEVKENLIALSSSTSEDLLQEIDQIAAPVKHMSWPSGLLENSDV